MWEYFYWTTCFLGGCGAAVVATRRLLGAVPKPASTQPEPESADVMFFPDRPPQCPSMEMYGWCDDWSSESSKKDRCALTHASGHSFRIRRVMFAATSSVDVAAHCATSHALADILATLCRKGVKVRVLVDTEVMEENLKTEYFFRISEHGAEVRACLEDRGKGLRKQQGAFHHKFIVVDKRTVLTGSLNFTLRAILQNYEMVVATNIPAVVEDFVEEFEELWSMHSLRV